MKRFLPSGGDYRIIRKIAIRPYEIDKETRLLEIVYIVQVFGFSITFGYHWRDVRFANYKEYKRFRKETTFEQPFVTGTVYDQKVRFDT